MIDAAIIGGGPAGLRAAEVLAENGRRVAVFEQKPSVGRKFLVAGRGGLNLTHSEDLAAFAGRYGDAPTRWHSLLAEFGPAELRAWAQRLGVETYVGTSGRVFPRGQQAAVLLRRWVARLRELGVVFHVNRRLGGLRAGANGEWQLDFVDARTMESGVEPFVESIGCPVVILALGGASWPQTGSDGRWPALLQRAGGVDVAPWQAANCGWEVAWDPRLLAAAEGLPLKNLAARADDGGAALNGEALITRYGLEGGTLYQLGRRLRALGSAPRLVFDFKPASTVEQLLRKLVGQGRAGDARGWLTWTAPPRAGNWARGCARCWSSTVRARAPVARHWQLRSKTSRWIYAVRAPSGRRSPARADCAGTNSQSH